MKISNYLKDIWLLVVVEGISLIKLQRGIWFVKKVLLLMIMSLLWRVRLRLGWHRLDCYKISA